MSTETEPPPVPVTPVTLIVLVRPVVLLSGIVPPVPLNDVPLPPPPEPRSPSTESLSSWRTLSRSTLGFRPDVDVDGRSGAHRKSGWVSVESVQYRPPMILP